MSNAGKTLNTKGKTDLGNYVYIVTAGSLVSMLPTTTTVASGLLANKSEFSKTPRINSEVIVLNNGNCIHGVLTATGWVLDGGVDYNPSGLDSYDTQEIAICLKANGVFNRYTFVYSVDDVEDTTKLPTIKNKATGDFANNPEFAELPNLGSMAIVGAEADIYILTHTGWVACKKGISMELFNYAKSKLANENISSNKDMNIVSDEDLSIKGESVKIESTNGNIGIDAENNATINAGSSVTVKSSSGNVTITTESGDINISATDGEVYVKDPKTGGTKVKLVDYIKRYGISGVDYEYVDLAEKFSSEISNFDNQWLWIQDRIQSGNFEGINIGNYLTFEMEHPDGLTKTMHAQVAGINTYKNFYGYSGVDNHIDFVCKECYGWDNVMWNESGSNNGTAQKKAPYLASDIHTYLTGDVYNALPEELQEVLADKRLHIEERYSNSGTLTESNSTTWNANLGKLWLPSEFEILGNNVYGNAQYCDRASVQYPLFKTIEGRYMCYYSEDSEDDNENDAYPWTLTCVNGDSSGVVCWSCYGSSCGGDGADNGYSAPVCFRIS